MPRFESNLTKAHVAAIYQLFDDGNTARQVHCRLQRAGRPMSIRNVYNYRTKWQENEGARASSQAVVWEDVDRLIAAGVLREHLPALRSVSAWTISTFRPSGIFDPHPSYRTLRWQSYVLAYTESVHMALDIWVLGELFAFRQTYSDYMKEPIEKDDLDALLTFTPWEGEEKEQRYLEAIDQGLIPKQVTDFTDVVFIKQQWFRASVALTLANLSDAREYRLPSQQAEERREEGKGDIVLKVHIGEKTTAIRLRI